MVNITKKQRKLLLYLHDFRNRHGDGPTMAMIANDLGLASNRSVIDMINLLVNRGYLHGAVKTSRSTRLTEKALLELQLLSTYGYRSTASHGPSTQSFTTPSNISFRPSHRNWQDIRQPSGTGLNDQIIQLLHNALSIVAYNGTGQANSLPEKSTRITLRRVTMLVISMAVSGGITYMMFGDGPQAVVLIALCWTVIIIRSIK